MRSEIYIGADEGSDGRKNQGSRLTWNPKAFSSSGGTYLWSLFRSTHSRSSGELWYCSGESLSESTTLSNELSENGRAFIAAGLGEFEVPRWGDIEPPSLWHYSWSRSRPLAESILL